MGGYIDLHLHAVGSWAARGGRRKQSVERVCFSMNRDHVTSLIQHVISKLYGSQMREVRDRDMAAMAQVNCY